MKMSTVRFAKISHDGVGTEVSALAFLAMLAHPYLIKLIHRLLYDGRVIGQDTSLKVPFVIPLHANARTCKVGTPDIYFFAVKNIHFEVKCM